MGSVEGRNLVLKSLGQRWDRKRAEDSRNPGKGLYGGGPSTSSQRIGKKVD